MIKDTQNQRSEDSVPSIIIMNVIMDHTNVTRIVSRTDNLIEKVSDYPSIVH